MSWRIEQQRGVGLFSPTSAHAASQYQITTNTVSTPHVKPLKPPTGISGREQSKDLQRMRKIIKGPGRQHEAVLSVLHNGPLYLLLCKILSQIVSFTLTRPQSKECQKLDWSLHRGISHGPTSVPQDPAYVPQDPRLTKMSQKELRKWLALHSMIIVRRLGTR